MSIRETFDEALSSPPRNESTTCDWVIYPVLMELGYSRRDVLSRLADSNGQFPDYTLLPDSKHTWYLEAKDWSLPLQDRYAQQSLNYANQNGRRWVVLTNGQVWRLYDNDIRGTATDKLVTEADIRNPDDAFTFLQALGKSSITNGGLERYASNVRLASELGAQLRDPSSEVVKALWGVVKRLPGLQDVTKRRIAAYFAAETDTQETTDAEDKSPSDVTSPSEIDAPTPLKFELTLGEIASDASNHATGRKPTAITFPDGTQTSIRNWADVTQEFVRWISSKGLSFPVPFQGTERGKRFFINTEPVHPDRSKMMSVKEVETDRGRYYIHTQRSAANLVARMMDLCNSAGIQPKEVRIRLSN